MVTNIPAKKQRSQRPDIYIEHQDGALTLLYHKKRPREKNMAQFLTELVAKKDGDGDDHNWVLHDPLGYYSDILQDEVWVPAGFETDLASVPRVPLAWYLAGGTGDRAAVVHDFLCRVNPQSRHQADRVFKEALKVEGVNWWRRQIMYAGVRIGALFS